MSQAQAETLDQLGNLEELYILHMSQARAETLDQLGNLEELYI